MPSLRKQFLLVAILFTLSNDLSVASSETAPDKYRICTWTRKHVYIENELGANKILTVHCKSDDDNLGVHYLKYGETYEFHFRDSWFGNTLFTCVLSHARKHAEIEVYDENRDCYHRRCDKHCRWNATRDAILGYSDTNPPKQDITVVWQQ
ncbi:hypothetical protein L6164_016523 [Bauhinia variegata]|uniref:Uncharacterized protein n=1 Tax=Bauhinia variegata TaxID=167791 RepID=A0ACB9NRF0_BAUVA|nr:hypothetical protein L6164_016523 [Bauhinia variegata]